MNVNKEYLSISITFPKPIIERDDGQSIFNGIRRRYLNREST